MRKHLLAASAAFALASLPLFGTVITYEYMTITPAAGSQGAGVHVLTDYVPKNDTVIRAKFASSSNSGSSNNQFLFCSRQGASTGTAVKHFSFAPNVGGKFRWDYYGTQYAAGSSFSAGEDYELEVKNGKATLTKLSDSSTTVLGPDALPAEFVPEYKLALFQSYTMSGSSYGSWGNSFHGKFYYLKAYEIEHGAEVLKHWFVPCLDGSTVKICDLADGNRLYDLVATSSGAAAVGGNAALSASLELGNPAGSSIPVGIGIVSLGEATSATVSVEVSTDAAFTNPVATSFGTATTLGQIQGNVAGLTVGTTYFIRLVLVSDQGETYATSAQQFTAAVTPVAVACEVTTVPYVKDASFATWGSQSTTNPDAEPVCLFKNLKLEDIIGFSADSYRAFGSYNFARYAIDTLYAEKPVQETRNNYDFDGFYLWNVAEDGQSATLQVQTKAHGQYNGQLLGVEFLMFTQVGNDIWGCIRGIKYCYNCADYGDDCTAKPNSNSCKYYYDTDAMNSGHATMNFSLQNLKAYAYPATDSVTVTFFGKDGEVLGAQVVEPRGSATAPTPPAYDGFVFYGWDASFEDVRSDMAVTALYHRLCTVNFLDKDGDVYQTVANVEEMVTMDAEDIPAGPAAAGYVFHAWSPDPATTAVVANENGVATIAPVYHRLCTVNFLDMGGVVYQTVSGVEETTKMSAEDIPEGPEVAGYVFKSWAPDLTATAVSPDENGVVAIAPVYHRLCTVNFLNEDGSVYQEVADVEEEVAMSAEAIPEGPTVAGQYFTGWTPDYTKTPLVADENGIAVATPNFIACHTVTFVGRSGRILKVESVPDGHSATPPDMTGQTDAGAVFVGWDRAYTEVTSDLRVVARFLSVKAERVDVEYPMQPEAQVFFADRKLKDVVGVDMTVQYRYKGNPGGCYYTNECSSLEAPLPDGLHVGTGIYNFQKSDTEVTFEFRGINSTTSNNGLACACKWRLWQEGDDIVGKLVWFKAGCDSNNYMDRTSWDNVSLTYDFGFVINKDDQNYTLRVLDMKLFMDISYIPTVLFFR